MQVTSGGRKEQGMRCRGITQVTSEVLGAQRFSPIFSLAVVRAAPQLTERLEAEEATSEERKVQVKCGEGKKRANRGNSRVSRGDVVVKHTKDRSAVNIFKFSYRKYLANFCHRLCCTNGDI